MPITIIINVNIVDSPVALGLSTIDCTGLTYNIVSGGTSYSGTDDFNILVNSPQVIIDVYDVSSNCTMPYDIYGILYEQGENCNNFLIHVTDECIIPPIPDISYECVSGLIINNYDSYYTYNIQPNTQLNQGSYILTSIDNDNGCYSAVSFSVPECCPGYILSATFTCVTATPNVNELNIIVLDVSGNVLNTNITDISLIGEGNVECPLPTYVGGIHPNFPTGYTFTNTCSGFFNVGVSITLEEGCVLQDTVDIDCLCIDCTENPFNPTDDCCYGGKVWDRGGLGAGCTQSRCGYIDPFPVITQIEGWTVNTTTPSDQGLFSIQFIPSAIADKIRVIQDNVVIAESPAVGFWNMTFCETDDVLGFWTNGMNNAGSISSPWIYDKNTNPGVSGMDEWFPIYDNDCGWNEGLACAHRELGMKERRGAGELFFELQDNGPNSIVIVQVIFSPNRTVCTQDCTPKNCPFCNGLLHDGKFKHDIVDSCGDPPCPSGLGYLDVLCSNLLIDEYIENLPLWNYDNIYSIEDNSNTGNCQYASQNGLYSCNDFPSGTDPLTYPNVTGSYHYKCDASNLPQAPVFNLQTSSGIRWGVRSYSNQTCNPDLCVIQYKNFGTSCTPGLPQFSWLYSYNILEGSNAFIIIDAPVGVNLVGKRIKDNSENYYNIAASGSNYIVYLNAVTDTEFFYGFFDSVGNQAIVPYGTYIFTTYDGSNPSCYDVTEIETICECPTINGFSVDTLCVNEQIASQLSITLGDCTYDSIDIDDSSVPSGMIYTITESPFKVQFFGTPLVTGTYNIGVTIDCLDCYITGTETLTVVSPNCSYSSNIVNPRCGLANGSITLSAFTCPTASITWLDGATGTTRTNLSADTYIMYIDDANGCQVSGSFTLTNVGAPTFTSPDRIIACTATGTTITLLSISGGVSPYSISISSVVVATGVTGATYTTTGQYVAGVYNVVLTDSNGCSSSDYVVLTQTQNPTVNFLPTNITCSNPNGAIKAIFSTNYNDYEIYYSTSSINCNNFSSSGILIYDTDAGSDLAILTTGEVVDIVSFTVNTSGTYYMCFSDTSSNCCTCGTVRVNGSSAPPSPSISNITSCNNSIITVTGTGECVSGSTIGYYTAPSANTQITNGQVISGTPHFLSSSNLIIGSFGNYMPTGTYTYYSACTYGSCLTGFDSFDVIITSAPSISITNVSGCAGTYTVSATPGFNNYIWKKNGVTQASTTSTLFTDFAGYTGSETNYIHTLSVTGTTANGCLSSATGTVVIYPKPTLSVTSITICSPGIVNLFTQPSYSVNAGNQNYTYYTATANGYVFEYWNGSSWTSVGPSINVTTTNDYQIRVTSPNGCISDTATLHITVNSNPIIGITKNVNCTGAVLTASPGFTYLWNTGVTTQVITVTADGTYYVTGTQGSCTAATSTVVDIPAVPTISINGVSTCQNLPNVTGLLSIVGSYDYITVSSSNNNIVPNITATGATSVGYNTNIIGTATVTATAHYNNNTCTASTITTVTVNNSFVNFQDICYGQPLSDALVSSSVTTNNIIIMSLASNQNCIGASWDGLGCCNNWNFLGGQPYNSSQILIANEYVAFVYDGTCCRTDRFTVRGPSVTISADCHANANTGNTIIQIMNIGPSALQGTTRYTFDFTNVDTSAVVSFTQDVALSNITHTIQTTLLDRGVYAYEIDICYDIFNESDTDYPCCTVTGNYTIDCCPNVACNADNYWLRTTIGDNAVLSLTGHTPGNISTTANYYVYDVSTVASTGDYLVSGNVVAIPSGTLDIDSLGILAGDLYGIVFENLYARNVIYFNYNGANNATLSGSTFAPASNTLNYVSNVGNNYSCIMQLIVRQPGCYDLEGITGVVCASNLFTVTSDMLIPPGELTYLYINPCPDYIVTCSGDHAYLNVTAIVSDTNPLYSSYLFYC